MASKRETILSVFETRMKTIDGTGNFVYNLNNRVERIGEELDPTKYTFTEFPKMYYVVDTIDTEYMLGGYIRELMRVDAFTAFNAKLTSAQTNDFISDVYLALGTNVQDYKMNGNAEFFIVAGIPKAMWASEENLTVIHVAFNCQHRRLATER